MKLQTLAVCLLILTFGALSSIPVTADPDPDPNFIYCSGVQAADYPNKESDFTYPDFSFHACAKGCYADYSHVSTSDRYFENEGAVRNQVYCSSVEIPCANTGLFTTRDYYLVSESVPEVTREESECLQDPSCPSITCTEGAHIRYIFWGKIDTQIFVTYYTSPCPIIG